MAKQKGKTFPVSDGGTVRSSYEQVIYEALLKDSVPFEYEPSDGRIAYTFAAEYVPDFCVTTASGKIILIECKGYFRARNNDMKKYKAIKLSRPDVDLRFVFKDASKPVRKNAKLTLSGWCEKLGFPWAENLTIPKSWLNE